MRTAPVLVAAVLVACFACTYDIPDLDSRSADDGGDTSEASTDEASGDDTSRPGMDSGHPGDTGVKVDAACTGVLCACNHASDCASGVCALSETVGPALYQAAGNTSFCTRPCCNSVDCDAGTVCFASGVGGNYCVDPAWLGRASTLGTGMAGSTCTSNAQCRAGLCASERCADTCCSFQSTNAECAQGSQCAFGGFPGAVSLDTHFTALCGPPGGASTGGAPCNDSNQCAGGLCYPSSPQDYCVEPCGSSTECATGSGCQLDFQDSDMYFACFPWPGTDAEDTSCSSDMQCLGGWCQENLCTNVCFTDASCVSGWRCTPQADDGFPTGNYLVLVCGP